MRACALELMHARLHTRAKLNWSSWGSCCSESGTVHLQSGKHVKQLVNTHTHSRMPGCAPACPHAGSPRHMHACMPSNMHARAHTTRAHRPKLAQLGQSASLFPSLSFSLSLSLSLSLSPSPSLSLLLSHQQQQGKTLSGVTVVELDFTLSAGATRSDGSWQGASSDVVAIIALLMGLRHSCPRGRALSLLKPSVCAARFLCPAMPRLQMGSTHRVFILCSPLLPVAHISACRGAAVTGKRWLLLHSCGVTLPSQLPLTPPPPPASQHPRDKIG